MTKDGNSDRLLSSSPNTDGGPGSGNFGHAGRPERVGGSAATHGSIETKPTPKKQYSSKEEYRATVSQKKQAFLSETKRLTAKNDAVHGAVNKSVAELDDKIDAVIADNSIDDRKRFKIAGKYMVEQIVLYEKLVSEDQKCRENLKKVFSPYDEVYDPYYEYSHISGNHSIEEDSSVSLVNPDGLEENCQRCVIAYEMRRRGYDVTASDGEGDVLASGYSIGMCFDGAESFDYSYGDIHRSVNEIKGKMSSFPDGTRAIAFFSSSEDTGHVINLEKSNGEVIAVDSQRGSVIQLKDIFDESVKNRPNISSCKNASLMIVSNASVTAIADEYIKEV